MPKQVDHQERRQEIAAAVCRLAATRGLEEVSLRHVAAEAGVSMGRVQHYFKTKDEMLLFAFGTIGERVEQRLAAAIAALGQPPEPRALIRTMLIALLPIGTHAEDEAPMWIAFLARAVVEPALANPLRNGNRQLRAFVTDQLDRARLDGTIAAALDPTHEALTLLALADGLLLRILLDEITTDTALAALDYQLDRIFQANPH